MPTKQTPQESKVNTTSGEGWIRPCCENPDCTTLILRLQPSTESRADGGN
jgi:hypothetical protein